MKALELIKQIKNADENPYHKTRTIIFNRDDMAFIKEAIAELEALQQRSCDGCKTLPFVLTELAKKNGGKCGTCKRYVKDNYEAEPKDNE